MSDPHNHHYIPQFWLRRFSDDGQSAMVWSYVWDKDTVEKRSTRTLMSGYDLYTKKTSAGDDFTLETGEMGRVDGSGALLFQRLDQGERSVALRDSLADFFAVMVLRHPVTVKRHPIVAADFLIRFQQIFASVNNLADLDTKLAQSNLPASGMDATEFALLKSYSEPDLDAYFSSLFDQLLAPGGHEEIPFADTIEDPSGRGEIKSRLLDMQWILLETAEPIVVIGDAGIVHERGDLGYGWKIPIGPHHILSLSKSDHPVSADIEDGTIERWQVESLNLEAATRSKNLLIGQCKDAVLHAASQIRGGAH